MVSVNVYSVYERMYKMITKLYLNYLPKGEETYIVRTTNKSAVIVIMKPEESAIILINDLRNKGFLI